MNNYDLIVIGGGAAGMSAAISASKNGVESILLLEKEAELGGILNQCIHQGFGLHYFKEEMTGPSYASRLLDQVASDDKIKVSLNSFVLDINQDKQIKYSSPEGVINASGTAIVLGTGSYERHSSMINLPGKRLNGIYNAGVAQKYKNIYNCLIGKKVFILGSGDIGLIMARRMTLEGAEVVGVAELMPYSNGLTRNIVTCLEDFDIPLYLSHTVTAVDGDRNLSSVTISEVDNKLQKIDGTEKVFEVDTLLLAVGLIPVTELMEKLNLETDPRTKSVVIDSTYQTSIPGIFVCGNSLHVHDLVDYVSKEATIVGEYAAKYIQKSIEKQGKVVAIDNDENTSYVMPQTLDLNNLGKSCELFFRVRRPINECNVLIKINDNVIRKVHKHILLPAEMESVLIAFNKVEGEIKSISLSIEEV